MSISDKYAVSVQVADGEVVILLNDKQRVSVPFAKFAFLARATEEQRCNFTIEPHGFAIYWPDLDDGFEIEHVVPAGVDGNFASQVAEFIEEYRPALEALNRK
jgi:hypothetical protein